MSAAPGETPSFAEWLDHAPVALWAAGPDGRRVYFNKRWLEFTGRSLEEEKDDGWTAGIHHEDFERCLGTYLQALQARREFRTECRLRRSDGQHRWICETGVPYFASDGSFTGYVGSTVDITE